MTAVESAGGGLHRLLSAAPLRRSRFSSSRTGRAGQGVDRVLLIGDRRALVSRDDPEVRLAEHLADAVVSRTGRGLKLDTVWDLVPVLKAIGGATRSRSRWQYDAVVVLIHSTPTRMRFRTSATVQRLLMRVLHQLGPATCVELVFLDPETRTEAGRAARRFSRQVLAGLDDPGSRVGSITVPSGLRDAVGDAAAVAEALASRLPRARAAAAPSEPADADARATGLVRAAATPGLQRVVTLAVRSFDVPFAAVSLFDGPVIRTVASTAERGPSIDGLLQAFARTAGPVTLVPDLADQPQPHEARSDGIRFWAAYPIRSLAGELLGAVSVFDTAPHDLFTGDDIMLHDLAQLAGAEIDAYRPGD